MPNGDHEPHLPERRRSVGDLPSILGEYVTAFARTAFWAVVAILTCGAAYVAIRATWFGIRICCKALGV